MLYCRLIGCPSNLDVGIETTVTRRSSSDSITPTTPLLQDIFPTWNNSGSLHRTCFNSTPTRYVENETKMQDDIRERIENPTIIGEKEGNRVW